MVSIGDVVNMVCVNEGLVNFTNIDSMLSLSVTIICKTRI